MLQKRTAVLYFAWAVSLAGLLGSLYYSEIRHLVPCVLCWYQRICLYPLAVIFAVGLLKKDKYLPYYVLPLSLIGGGIALFHYLLQLGIIPDSLAPCTQGISCASVYVEYFGFITIPFMSLVAFTIISICMWLTLRWNKAASATNTLA
ncbi:MAG: disulfide oxidoreductase [Candidatus Andersenbacteria bacterium]